MWSLVVSRAGVVPVSEGRLCEGAAAMRAARVAGEARK